MTNLFSTSFIRNIYKKPSKKSEVISQIIYGEKIKILKIKNRWLKIKTHNDNYSGYIKNEKLKDGLKIIFKTNKLKTRIISKNKKKIFLTFNSRLPIISKRKKKYIYLLLILMIASGISEALTITILFPLIQNLISPGENLDSFIKYLPISNNSTILMASIFTFLLILSSIIRVTNIFFTGRISALIGAEIGGKIFSNILNFNYMEFNSINSSDLIKSLSINLDKTVITINLILNSIVAIVISIIKVKIITS